MVLEPNGHWRERRWWGGLDDPVPPPETFVTCFRAGYDYVIPPFVGNGTALEPVSPFATRRNISIIARFGDNSDHFGVRKVWLDFLEEKQALLKEVVSAVNIVTGKASFEETAQDFRSSVFCLAPQGQASFTGRMSAIIMSGCIPVTFFSSTECPFEGVGLDWTRFSVNFDLELAQNRQEEAFAKLLSIYEDPARLHSLQDALASVQRFFNWDREAKDGVQASVVGILKDIAERAPAFHREQRTCQVESELAAMAERVETANRAFDEIAAVEKKIPADQLWARVLPDFHVPLVY